MVEITPRLVLQAYAAGVFPMAEAADDERLFWVDPDKRGVLPLDRFHLPRSLRKTVRSERFEVSINRDFEAVITACGQSRPERPKTWINRPIMELYCSLNRSGYAHSVECRQQGELVGGLYGVSLGGAFFGESMFSLRRDASKVALVHLVGRLVRAGFTLLDTQFVTSHLGRFGAIEVPRADYHRMLEDSLGYSVDFTLAGAALSAEEVLQSITQTS